MTTRLVRLLTACLSWPALFPLFRAIQKFCLHATNRTSAGFLPVGLTGEPHAVRAALARVPAGRTAVVLDCGANEGAYTALVLDEAARAGCAVVVHQFEPSARCGERLRQRFGQDARVRLHVCAVSDAVGRALLHFPWAGAGGSSLSKETSVIQGTTAHGADAESIVTTTLDACAASEGLERIDLLKLDIEGHEWHALAGAAGLVAAGRVEAIQVEIGAAALPAGVSLYRFWRHLHPAFDCALVMTHGLRRIETYLPDLECFYAASTFLFLRRHAGVSEAPAAP